MEEKNIIQESNDSPFKRYQNEVQYDIVLEGTIAYKIKAIEGKSSPNEDQVEEAEMDILKQIENLMEDEDYFHEIFKETGISLGRVYPLFLDEYYGEELGFRLGISKIDASKELDVDEIKDYFEMFLKDIDSDLEGVSVVGRYDEHNEEIPPTYVSLYTVGEPSIKVVSNKLNESVEKEGEDMYKLVLLTKMDNEFKPDCFVQGIDKDSNVYIADSYTDAQDYTEKDANNIITNFKQKSPQDTQFTLTKVPTEQAEEYEQKHLNETMEIDKRLVTQGRIDFLKECNTKSIILNDNGQMELYENNVLTGIKPFSKLSVTRQYNKNKKECYTLGIKNESNINTTDPQEMEQTKQEIEQSIKDVEEIQQLKDELEDKVNELYSESKIEEEKLFSFPTSEFTEKELTVEELYNLVPEKELTINQIAYITKVFGSIEAFKQSLVDFVVMTGLDFNTTCISIDDYVKSVENKVREEEN